MAPDQMEAQPVRVVLAVAADRGEEALGRGVGPDHQGHVAEAGQDLGPGVVDGLGPRGAGGVGRGHPGPGPPQGLGEGGAGHEAGVAVADGVGPGHVLDVGPGEAGVGQGVAGRGQPVLDEVAAPLAPGVHARARGRRPACRQASPDRSLRPLRTGARSRSAAATSTPGTRARRPRRGCRARARPRRRRAGRRRRRRATSWPMTTICSAASSTAAMAKGT